MSRGVVVAGAPDLTQARAGGDPPGHGAASGGGGGAEHADRQREEEGDDHDTGPRGAVSDLDL